MHVPHASYRPTHPGPSTHARDDSWLALLLLLAVVACAPHEAPQAPASDIILVTIDTWRADAAGFAGSTAVKTPYLDSLAARGIVFTNAHAHNVITLPSHTNILTGLNPYQHGVRENAGFVLDAKYTTVAETLHANGYATGAFVGAFPLDARFGLNQGFDVYDDNYGKGRASIDFSVLERPANAVLTAATQWWQSNAGRKRFLWVHLYDAHAPYAPPQPFAETYRQNLYLGEVAAVDDALSRQLAPLLADDTTLIITADHGEALGDHGELTHGLFAYESTLKVPLIVIAPGAKPHAEAAYVRHIDIAPTILQRAGVTSTLPGQSLLGPIKSVDTYFESLSASLNRGWAPLTGVIQSGEKYIDLPLPELYDLANDPAEKQNLVDERRRDVAAARKLLATMQVAPQPNRAAAAEEAASLRSLGYLTGVAASDRKITIADDPKNLVHVDAEFHEIVEAFQLGHTADAVRRARKLVGEQPRMPAGRELLAFVLQEDERVDEAIDVLARLAAEGVASDSAKVQLGLLLTETGKSAAAVSILGPIVSRAPNADNLNGYGIALADQGRFDEATQQFRRALDLDPNNAPALQNLGIVALRRNDVRGAHDYLTRALAMNPRLPLALNTLGVLYARQNDDARAVAAWQGAVALDPKQYDALFNIGLVAGRSGRVAEAKHALEQFVRTAPPARYAKDIATAKRALAALQTM
jgi:arylsulfatase A-like enzyme/cytochrome c-type biogenesis protein CcmH/NrfG